MNVITQLFSVPDDRDYPGSPRQREMSRALLSYLLGDFTDARTQRVQQFPKRGDKHQLRVTPWLQRLATDLGQLYHEPPERRLLGASDADAAGYLDLLEVHDANGAFELMNWHAIILGQAYALVWPDPDTRGARIVVFAMHDLEVDLVDPTRSDVNNVRAVRARLTETDSAGVRSVSVLEITATEAWWVMGPRAGKGRVELWSKDGSGRNPLGVIPLLAVRRMKAEPGDFFVFVPEDKLCGQRAQDRSWTSLLHVSDGQGYSQPWLKLNRKRDDSEELEIGMETAVELEEGEEFGYATPTPDLSGYLAQTRAYIETETAMAGLSPSAFLKSSAITGVARQVEMFDRAQERKGLKKAFARVEQDLHDLTRRWQRVMYGSAIGGAGVRVRVSYHFEEPPSDELHKIQRLEREVAMGLTSPVEILMQRHKLTRDEALARLEQNKADRALAGWVPPASVAGAQDGEGA